MTKLAVLVISMSCLGCVSHTPKRVAEAPDPSVGDLRCQAPRMSVSEALYYVPGPISCSPED